MVVKIKVPIIMRGIIMEEKGRPIFEVILNLMNLSESEQMICT